MDYKAKIKERMSKLLFLEMNKDGFKENIGIPSYVTFKNKDLYLPISSEYISSNINDEIKISISQTTIDNKIILIFQFPLTIEVVFSLSL